jgi:plastocyanin
MRTSHRLRALLALVFVLGLVVAACGDDNDTDAGSGSDATTAPAAGDGITIAAFQFEAPASVEAGSAVEITNTDSAPHTVTADDGAFDSSQIDPDGSASITAPSEPGTYAFHCEVHPTMKGELVVA